MSIRTLRFASGVEKDLTLIDTVDARFIAESREFFAPSFSIDYEVALMESGKVKALVGEWKGYHRPRLRSWRTIYRNYNDTLVILVVRVSHCRTSD